MQPNQLAAKPHYPILDGLRGVAALLIVIYHLFEAYYPVPANHPEHHGYLAMIFFTFCPALLLAMHTTIVGEK